MECRITLEKSSFTEAEKILVRCGEFTASAFRYSTGVEAVRLANARGEIIALPWNGQQIWRASFDNRPLHMKSMFREPRPAAVIVDSYGCFTYHCGALRMGNPLPGDDYILHGELPCARYHAAALVAGEDEQGAYLGLTGTFEYRKGFGDFYNAAPSVLLRAGSAVLDMSMRVENIGHAPMDLMYMLHVNFRMGDGARIAQTTGWTREDMILRAHIPSHVTPTPKLLAFMERLKDDPRATETLRPEDDYDPEIVFFLRNMRAGEDGLARVLQVHADGAADMVAYDPKILNRHVRWMYRNAGTSAIGLIPATAEPDGYAAEKEKGNVRSLGAGESAVFAVRAGALSATEAAAVLESL